jgi:heavy metal translocating P-type ATPase
MKYLKNIVSFFMRWKLFSLALLSLILAIVLTYFNLSKLAHVILAIVALFEVIPLLMGMWEDIKDGSYGIDILAATAIVASVILGEYWAAIVVVIMLTGGESLEDYADHKAMRELDSLLKRAPVSAHLLKNKNLVDVKVGELKVGDYIVIKPGEVVPVDSIVTEGTSSFDESSLTGESVPVTKKGGEKLLSGAVNIEGSLTAKVLATAENSQYQQIIKLVKSAAASKSPFVRLADRYSIPFTIISYAIAVTVWVISGHAIRFLEVIIVATPCPLLLAAPIALISGMSRASRHGIIVKTGSALERLAEAKTIAFDKTGTLTNGDLRIKDVHLIVSRSKDEVLTLAASLEQYSGHIIAQSIVDEAKSKNIKLPKIKGLKEIPGKGLTANFKNHRILVGKVDLLEDEGLSVPDKLSKLNTTSVFVARDNEILGYITLEDTLRDESKKTIFDLTSQGIKHLIMVTGDNQKTAERIAAKIGITEIVANALPADKLNAIERLKNRPVAFVGDGINDAPVLTASDIGIALGARGSTAASESADMVIMLDDITRVASAHKIAKRTFSIAKQSILAGIALSVVLMVIFATGKFKPLYGAILQEVVDVVVIFNALRAHY